MSHASSRADFSTAPRVVFLVVVLFCLAGGTWPDAAAAGQSNDDPAATRLFNLAAERQNAGDYAQAAQKWADLIKDHPKDSRLDKAHYHLGVCRMQEQKYAAAAEVLRTLLAKYPKFEQADAARYQLATALYRQATASKKAEEYRAAAEQFSQTAKDHPQSPHADSSLYLAGEALVAAGDLDGASKAYGKLIAAYPKSSLLGNAYYALGTAQQDQGRHQEAAATFAAFLGRGELAAHELAPEIRLRLGMARMELKDYPAAAEAFAAAADSKPAAGSEFAYADLALLRWGQALFAQGKSNEAAAKFDLLVARFPKSEYRAAARLSAGKCYFQGKQWDKAQAALRPLAAEKSPEGAEAAYWVCRSLLESKQPAAALKQADEALKTQSNEAASPYLPYLQMARIDALYDLDERRKETPALYAGFAKQNAAHELAPQARYMAAFAALGVADYDTARREAETFLADGKLADHALRPAVLHVAGEATLLAAAAKGADAAGPDTTNETTFDATALAKAEGFYRQLVERAPDDPRAAQARLRIGWCLLQSKKPDEAVRELSAALGKLSDPEQIAECQLLLGQSHAAVDRHAEAATAFAAALAAKGDWGRADEVLMAWAQSLRAANKADEAARQLDRLAREQPNSALRTRAVYLLGELAQDAGKYDEAIGRYREALAREPKGPLAASARFGLGASQFAKGDYSAAVTTFGELIAEHGDSPRTAKARLWRGLAHQRLKQFSEAVADLTGYLDTKPSGSQAVDARYALALARMGLKQYDQAAELLASLAKDQPDYAQAEDVQYNLAYALLEQKQAEPAMAAFRAVVERWPDGPVAAECWFQIGRHHEQAAAGKPDEKARTAELAKAAQAYSSGAAHAKPNQAELREKLRYKLGDVQFRQQQYAEAAKTLLAQIDESPEGTLAGPARFLAAESLLRGGQPKEALPLFEQAAKDVPSGQPGVKPYAAQALYQAGACATALKDWPASQRHYQALLAEHPKFEQAAEARYGLALALQQQSKFDQARKLYEQVTDETESETAAKARFMIGEIAFAEKKYDEAIDHYLTVAAGYPYRSWQALARFEAGRCYQQQQKLEQAIQTFRIVVEKYPEHEKAADARRLIEELKGKTKG